MTPAQLATLKADILADPVLAAKPTNSDGAFYIAAAYNLPASPAFTVWKSRISTKELRDAVASASTQLDGLTGSKREALLWLVAGELDARLVSTRAALDDLTGGQQTLKAALVAAQKRECTRAEKLFSTGTGTPASPATTTFEGVLSYQDVEAARAS